MASEESSLHIMFPMVSDLQEFFQIKKIIDHEINRETQRKGPRTHPVQQGVMVEVPALAWQIRDVLPHVDFVSVGSNDLFQFFYAADRSNPYLADRYHPLSPPFLKLLQVLVKESNRVEKPITLCGEMARDPFSGNDLAGSGISLFVHVALGPGRR